MESTLLFWVIAAVLLFWAVGAYNRLVRLRSEVNAAFAVLESELSRQVAQVHAVVPTDEARQAASAFDGGAFWAGLQGAAAQLAATLAAAKARPLEADRIAALGSAQEVLATAWERAEREDAHDLAGSRLPQNLSLERAQTVHVAQVATEQFNLTVARYNEAIAQFPAAILAWLFGFQPGRGLRARH